ncbi:hypothetical protein IMZ48_13545 [Candidatus Bathyarchaeota archaeon]|nr:hypothetical protein [Candidatus Bathyarchaeota archaeon]
MRTRIRLGLGCLRMRRRARARRGAKTKDIPDDVVDNIRTDTNLCKIVD